MVSVTKRISDIKQPYGGYVPVKSMKKTELVDDIVLADEENIHPALIGLVVDYLTRFTMGAKAKDAFEISLLGADLLQEYTNGKYRKAAKSLLKKVKGLDDRSISSACKLCGFDVVYRANPLMYKPIEEIEPDGPTISNIRSMVERSACFWKQYGPVVVDGFTFPGGYTDLITAGDGDYLTEDTLWDFKVSKSNPTSKHTLQILIYYIMGKHSADDIFDGIRNLAIYNPKKNTIWSIGVDEISDEVIEEVSKDVIGYRSPIL